MNHAKQVHAVANHAGDYIQQWYCKDAVEAHTPALLLLAAGSGSARVSACTLALRRKIGEDHAAKTVLCRALSLFRQGELQELRVIDAAVLQVIAAAVTQPTKAKATARAAPQRRPRSDSLSTRPSDLGGLSAALESLQVLSCPYNPDAADPATALIDCSADTLLELDCYMTETPCKARDQVLARCKRLESLSPAYCYTPAAWLGLSQLHTLRGVKLDLVPIAAIVAALPKLHTFHCCCYRTSAATSIDGLFEDLLPRLREFRFDGYWGWTAADASPVAAQPLPLLQKLTWLCETPKSKVHLAFAGAQPTKLMAHRTDISDWAALAARDGAISKDTEVAPGPLARVRELTISGTLRPPKRPAAIAPVLRAAPQLRHLTINDADDGSNSIFDILNNPSGALGDFVHSRLSVIAIGTPRSLGPRQADFAKRLQRQHFPCLQVVEFDNASVVAV